MANNFVKSPKLKPNGFLGNRLWNKCWHMVVDHVYNTTKKELALGFGWQTPLQDSFLSNKRLQCICTVNRETFERGEIFLSCYVTSVFWVMSPGIPQIHLKSRPVHWLSKPLPYHRKPHLNSSHYILCDNLLKVLLTIPFKIKLDK